MMTYMVESHPMGDRQHEFARQMRAQPTDAERAPRRPRKERH
jgi:hypothetical protein